MATASCSDGSHKYWIASKVLTKVSENTLSQALHIFKECVYCDVGVHHKYDIGDEVLWIDTPDPATDPKE